MTILYINLWLYLSVVTAALSPWATAFAPIRSYRTDGGANCDNTRSLFTTATRTMPSKQAWIKSTDLYAHEEDTMIESADQITSSDIRQALVNEDIEQARRLYSAGRIEDHILCSAILNSHTLEKFSGTSAAADAEAWIGEIVQPDNETRTFWYTIVLKAWKVSRDPSAMERAESLLERMEEMKISNSISYSTIITMYSDRGNAGAAKNMLSRMKSQGIPVTTQTLNIVMKACAKGNDVEGAAAILDSMETAYLQGDTSIAPNSVSYSILMDGYSKMRRADSLELVEDVFRRQRIMYTEHGNEEAQPDHIVYMILIFTMCQFGESERAEATLLDMYEQYKQDRDGNPGPRRQQVNVIIDCWCKSKTQFDPERAEKLLEWMIDAYQRNRDPLLQPDEISFSSAINGLAKSHKPDKAERARTLLERMKKLHADGEISSPPNAICYVSLLNVCVNSADDDRTTALQIVLATYKELINSEHCSPDPIAFDIMMVALKTLVPVGDKRSAAIGLVFRQCAEMGYVDEKYVILRRIQMYLTPKQLRQLVGADAMRANGTIDFTKLPREWSRNARGK